MDEEYKKMAEDLKSNFNNLSIMNEKLLNQLPKEKNVIKKELLDIMDSIPKLIDEKNFLELNTLLRKITKNAIINNR